MLIYAHRGASRDFPELTESAYLAAVAEGADGFECDVRLSRDEVPVLWHNPTMLERAGNHGHIAEMTFEAIKRAYPQVLTLNDFLDLAIENNKSVLIETKHPVISGTRVEEIVSQTVSDRKILTKINVSVMSFSWSAIEKMRRLNSDIPTTFLTTQRTLWPQIRFSSASSIGPGINELRADHQFISKIRKLNKSVAVWTVDEGSDIELCKDLGVDILITNTPAHARSFL
jgi:glycerophosphoryl diester phosphodiesterase